MSDNLEELIEQVSSLPDPNARALAIDLVQAVMSLHASALQRILELAPEAAPALGADELVSRVLVLHGLHPDDFEARLARAIDRLKQFFDSRGAGIEVLETGPDRVRIRFTGNRPGARGSAKQAIEDAIYEAAPEVAELIIEGAEEREPGFVPLASLLATS